MADSSASQTSYDSELARALDEELFKEDVEEPAAQPLPEEQRAAGEHLDTAEQPAAAEPLILADPPPERPAAQPPQEDAAGPSSVADAVALSSHARAGGHADKRRRVVRGGGGGRPAGAVGEGGTAASAGDACPPHPGWIHGMCFRCGALKPEGDGSEPEPGTTRISHLHARAALEVSGRHRPEGEPLQWRLAGWLDGPQQTHTWMPVCTHT